MAVEVVVVEVVVEVIVGRSVSRPWGSRSYALSPVGKGIANKCELREYLLAKLRISTK